MTQITDFSQKNLSNLNAELVHSQIQEVIIPKLVTFIAKETNNPSLASTQLLHHYHIKKLSLKTVFNWMKELGFKYKPHQKSYYVDTHKSAENVEYRIEVIKRYFDYEICCDSWISITIDKREKLVKEGKLTSELNGYEYEKYGIKFVEYHVDDHCTLQDNCKNMPFGGYLSVRKPRTKKKTMIIGQDECIFKQFLFAKSFWSLPDGTKQIIPKDDGHGVMLLSFCCWELGLGFDIPPDVLDIVNKKREGSIYSDEVAATTLQLKAEKPPLTTTPFTRQFKYGNNHEGYWSYHHMVLQLEDCVDVLKVLHPDFDFIFLFDHSNGHDHCMQPNRLSLNKISVRYGASNHI